MGILRELELVGTIPVNIERIIKGHGIALNTNAKPEDFNKETGSKDLSTTKKEK